MALTRQQLEAIAVKVKELQTAINSKDVGKIKMCSDTLEALIPSETESLDTEVVKVLRDLQNKVIFIISSSATNLTSVKLKEIQTFTEQILTKISSAIRKLAGSNMALTEQQLRAIANKIGEVQAAITQKDLEKISICLPQLQALIPKNIGQYYRRLADHLVNLQNEMLLALNPSSKSETVVSEYDKMSMYAGKALQEIQTVIRKLPSSAVEPPQSSKSHAHAQPKAKAATRNELRGKISDIYDAAISQDEAKIDINVLLALTTELQNALSLFAREDDAIPLTYSIDLKTHKGFNYVEFDKKYRQTSPFGKTFTNESQKALENLDKLTAITIGKLSGHIQNKKWLSKKTQELTQAIFAVKMHYAVTAAPVIFNVLQKFPEALKQEVLQDKSLKDLLETFIENNKNRHQNFLDLYKALLLLQQLYLKEHTSQKNFSPEEKALNNTLAIARNKIFEFVAGFFKGQPQNYDQLLKEIGVSQRLEPTDAIIRAGMRDAGYDLSDEEFCEEEARKIITEYSIELSPIKDQIETQIIALIGEDKTDKETQAQVQDAAARASQLQFARRGSIMSSIDEEKVAKQALPASGHEALRQHMDKELKDHFHTIKAEPFLDNLNKLIQEVIVCGEKLDPEMPACYKIQQEKIVENKKFGEYKPKHQDIYFEINKGALAQIEKAVVETFNVLKQIKQPKPGEIQQIYNKLIKKLETAESRLESMISRREGYDTEDNPLIIQLDKILTDTIQATESISQTPRLKP